MQGKLRSGVLCILFVMVALVCWDCKHEIVVEGYVVPGEPPTVVARYEYEGKKVTFKGFVGLDGVATWNINGHTGSVGGLLPGSPFTVTVDDPLLVEWPQTCEFHSGNWKAPLLGYQGDLRCIDDVGSVVGGLITDPGYSAHLLMAYPGVPETDTTLVQVNLVLIAEEAVPVCLKGANVDFFECGDTTVVFPYDPPGPELDFTQISGYPYEWPLDVITAGVHEGTQEGTSSWGSIKALFK